MDIQLILEIKSHKSKEVEDKMVADIVKMVKKMGLEKKVEYIWDYYRFHIHRIL